MPRSPWDRGDQAAETRMDRDSSLGAEARGPIDWLRSPVAIRTRCRDVLAAGLDGRLEHFAVRLERMPAVVRRVVRITRATHPDLRVPYHSRWNQFRSGGVDRVAALDARMASLPDDEQARVRFDLAITSVLLDTAAGPRWSYLERETGLRFERSEGLAVASLRMFEDGLFSAESGALRADADGLDALEARDVAGGFQASLRNPLLGFDGRLELLTRLGSALRAAPHLFGAERPRLGALFDHLSARTHGRVIPARRVLAAVLEGLGPIWPGRIELFGVNLGDVWRHPAAGGGSPTQGLVPFHALSQQVVYSLIEPLERAGLRVEGLDELTGLGESRNGGLFVDEGVLVPRHDDVLQRTHAPSSEVVVEWRALTVALLDHVAEDVRSALQLGPEQLPMCKVLEGGTWYAGREVARELRPDGAPPIRVETDGTVL
ncbi:DUF1688 family protein [Sandaracinus amylolyticus]|nr:DUF1688 family protein [Sandaracinus amylolyticus]